MDKTEMIRNLINNTGLNLKAFSQKANLPYSTLRSMLERGIENASVNNVIKVCSVLNISVESLYEMAEDTENNLSKEESTLLENYNKLNNLGKSEANKRISELTEINKYINSKENNVTELITATNQKIEDKPHLMPKASHDKEGNFTAQEYKHDDDIMNNDDFWNK